MPTWNAHDRLSLQRRDEQFMEERWQAPGAEVLVVAGTRIRPEAGAPVWLPADQAPEGTRVLLGDTGDSSRFAVIIDPASAPGEREEWVGLRSLFGHLLTQAGAELPDGPWLFHAIGLAEWHWATRFCPRCAGALQARAAGHELVCVSCGKPQFPRTDPAVIMTVTDGEPGSEEERLLLGRSAAWPGSRFSTLAGFCEPGENLEDAVRREVAEESGVIVGEVTYFASQAWPLPSSLMVGFNARAIDPTIRLHDAELEEARWFTRAELRAALESDEIQVPRSVSISSALLTDWFGQPLPGSGWR